ncbi:hypothetical protein [uncultured Thiodictyon sp.]|uniref:hypothetical protein n=1 Tax=uncultured Thiodictyon sp. TaxID=1846217 RepID=UPI0025E6CC23|nr:hypothetical protein [uncultured Thiodictyon sp.]
MGSQAKGRCIKPQAKPAGARFVLVIEDHPLPTDLPGIGNVSISLEDGQDMLRARTPAAFLIKRLSDWLDDQQQMAAHLNDQLKALS